MPRMRCGISYPKAPVGAKPTKVDIVSNKVGPATGQSTNIDMLLNYLKSHLATMSTEAVHVVKKSKRLSAALHGRRKPQAHIKTRWQTKKVG